MDSEEFLLKTASSESSVDATRPVQIIKNKNIKKLSEFCINNMESFFNASESLGEESFLSNLTMKKDYIWNDAISSQHGIIVNQRSHVH